MNLARPAPVLFALVLGCSSSGTTGFSSQDGGGADGASDGRARRDTGPDAMRLGGDASPGHAVKLTISPASPTVTVTDLAHPPTATLTASAVYSDGSTQGIAASWTVDRFDIASIGAGSGVLTPTTTTFGVVHVTATAGMLTATVPVTVKLHASLNPTNVTAANQASLGAATATDPTVTVFAYPYDGTVFPEGLLPPQQMWNGGAAGDVYSLEYVTTSFDLTVYTAADPPSRFTLPVATWNALTTTAPGSDVTVKLRRSSGGMAYVSASQQWSVADANLGGTIYYWAISQGQIEKIDLKTGTNSVVFNSGPSGVLGSPVPIDSSMPLAPDAGGPWQDNGAGLRCVACHSVSKDGSTLSSIFSRQASTGPLGFVSIAGAAVAAIGDYQADETYDALTPDGKLALVNNSAKTMQLLTSATGSPVASALDGVANLCDPAFSPDGTKLALATSCDPGFGWPVEFRTSDLSFYAFANATPYFSNPTTVVTSTGLGDAIAFPSFSPDSSFIFFQRGSYSRAKYTDPSNNPAHGIDDLYVVPAQTGATPIALAQANNPNGVLPADSQHLNYAPTVDPIAAGGYDWVVFTSPRDYGNVMVSPQGAAPMDATYSNHKQLWVAAVDANIGTMDPSHPPFWLPGQDPTTPNMFGYWALSPCLPTMGEAGASSCSAGFECCSGFCRDTGAGPVCVDNAQGCHQVGEKCTTTADCCGAASNVSCAGGVCQQTTPK
jgi:hypothetical protein